MITRNFCGVGRFKWARFSYSEGYSCQQTKCTVFPPSRDGSALLRLYNPLLRVVLHWTVEIRLGSERQAAKVHHQVEHPAPLSSQKFFRVNVHTINFHTARMMSKVYVDVFCMLLNFVYSEHIHIFLQCFYSQISDYFSFTLPRHWMTWCWFRDNDRSCHRLPNTRLISFFFFFVSGSAKDASEWCGGRKFFHERLSALYLSHQQSNWYCQPHISQLDNIIMIDICAPSSPSIISASHTSLHSFSCHKVGIFWSLFGGGSSASSITFFRIL